MIELQSARHRKGVLAQLRFLGPNRGGLQEPSDEPLTMLPRGVKHEVLEHGHALTSASELERPHEASCGDAARRLSTDVLAIKHDLAGGLRLQPRDAVERRRFSRTIRPDESGDAAGMHVEVHAVESLQAAEVAAQVANLEDGGAHKAAPRR